MKDQTENGSTQEQRQQRRSSSGRQLHSKPGSDEQTRKFSETTTSDQAEGERFSEMSDEDLQRPSVKTTTKDQAEGERYSD